MLSGKVGTGGTLLSTAVGGALDGPADDVGMGALAAAESRRAADDFDLNSLLILRFHPDCLTLGSGSGTAGSALKTDDAEGGSRSVFSGDTCNADRLELQVDGVGGRGPASN
jgi:hypothetical protein